MGHIHQEKGQHDLTVSAFIIRTDFDEPKIMLHNHKLLGQLLQAGGHVELNETPWQAIAHEIREETGYDLEQLSVLQPNIFLLTELPKAKVHPMPVIQSSHGFDTLWLDHYHTDITYAFITTELPNNEPAEGESTEIRWYSLEELTWVPEGEIIENIRVIGKYILTHIVKEWVPVPATKFEL